MNNFLVYMLVSSGCLICAFVFFKLFVDNRISPALIRVFLLAVVVFSLLLPLHRYSIRLGITRVGESLQQTEEEIPSAGGSTDRLLIQTALQTPIPHVIKKNGFSGWTLLKYTYFMVLGMLLFRLVFNLNKILYLRFSLHSQIYGEDRIIITHRIRNSFSFFGWIFMNREGKSDTEIQNIIEHEKIHALQYHSIDLLFMEFVIVVMWFNPVVWLIRNTLLQTHEFLADEGALKKGVSKSLYKAQLLNQVAEERLITLSSGFNPAGRPGRYSFIKRRIIMMTKPNFGNKALLRFLTLIPLTVLLFAGIACHNGQTEKGKKETVVAVAPTRMNVLYLGVDNPMSIAVSGYDADALRIEVEPGRILGEKGQYIIRPDKPGTLKVLVFAGEKLVSESHFRVKTVPDPMAKIAGMKGGSISREDLLKAGKVYVEMENFDFDLSWEIVSFVMSATVPGTRTVREEISDSGNFSGNQLDLIHSLVQNQKLMIEEIKARGPDGAIRELGSLVFTVAQ